MVLAVSFGTVKSSQQSQKSKAEFLTYTVLDPSQRLSKWKKGK